MPTPNEVIKILANRNGMIYPNNELCICSSVIDLLKDPESVTCLIPESERVDLFYTQAYHFPDQSAGVNIKINRNKSTFVRQSILAWDIDPDSDGSVDYTRIDDYLTAVSNALSLDKELFYIVSSGRGLHFIVELEISITESNWFTTNKSLYKDSCNIIKHELRNLKLPGKPDEAIFMATGMLRVPGSINSKQGCTDSLVKVIRYGIGRTNKTLNAMVNAKTLSDQDIPKVKIKSRFPSPDIESMIGPTGCLFLRSCIETPEQVHEPDFFIFSAVISNCGSLEATTEQYGRIGAKELARKVFQGATKSESLQRSNFEVKWDQAARYGCHSCDSIGQRWSFNNTSCEQCPHWGKISVPLQIKGKSHISTESNGFWFISENGKNTGLCYEDLYKRYCRDHSYYSVNDELWVWNGKFYRKLPPKSQHVWLNEVVSNPETLSSRHENEFSTKLLKYNRIENDEIQSRVFDSTIGMLNLQNGVLNCLTGELLEHSPDRFFTSVLDYSYDPNATCDYFLEWALGVMMQDEDFFKTLISVMAYCLYPKMDDHCFTFLYGEGCNGKSTFMEIIQKLVGFENVSSVSLKDLCGNRFMIANIAGKMVNMNEESSSDKINTVEEGKLKEFSSGALTMVEHKGQMPFQIRNNAKLIFSMNKVPRFSNYDQKAIERRQILIPFNYEIKTPDESIKHRLIKEIPGIVNHLVKEIKKNLAENNGYFKVYRPTKKFQEQQRRMAFDTLPSLRFADTCMVFTADIRDVLPVQDVYDKYREWCLREGYKPENSSLFSKTIRKHFLQEIDYDNARRECFDGKQVRVFRCVRWI